MSSSEKPWLDRYIKMAQALYNSDISNRGIFCITCVVYKNDHGCYSLHILSRQAPSFPFYL